MKAVRMLRFLKMKHLFMVSLALNVALILKNGLEGSSWSEERSVTDGICVGGAVKELMAHVSKPAPPTTTSRLQVTASPSPAASASSSPEVGHAGKDAIINLDHGDPTMYERYWQRLGDKAIIVINGWHSMSYFSDVKNLCWFLEPDFAREIVRLHKLVGNAITDNRHIVVGTGSSQLYQAALYALSPPNASEPMSVVSAAPYYSSYPLMTDFLKSGLHKWAGDAHKFHEDRPYIELVTTPNNPDGSTRQAVVNRENGILIHDLAYYWPQYTPISFPADYDVMLFTVSKTTGHAGTRIGWALVKDHAIAKKMTQYMELNTIGVSKDSQLRAAKILQAVSDGYDHVGNLQERETFFEYGHGLMEMRWKQLRAAVTNSGLFSLPSYSRGTCSFTGRTFETQPAFAWLKCEGAIEDSELFLRGHKILTRSGKHFGSSPRYVRVSMLDRDQSFNLFTDRLSSIKSATLN